MLRPKAHLRKLIAEASPAQAQTALAMTRRHIAACRGLDTPTVDVERILVEAFEIAINEPPPDAEEWLRERHRYYMRRTYSRTYTEQ